MTDSRPWSTRAVAVRAQSTSALSDAMLAKIRARSPDPSVFDDVDPFIWTCVASNGNLDAYGTKMAPRWCPAGRPKVPYAAGS